MAVAKLFVDSVGAGTRTIETTWIGRIPDGPYDVIDFGAARFCLNLNRNELIVQKNLGQKGRSRSCGFLHIFTLWMMAY